MNGTELESVQYVLALELRLASNSPSIAKLLQVKLIECCVL